MNFSLHLSSEEESLIFARLLAKNLTKPLVITFQGKIGAGKTTIIRAILRELGVKGAIKSPTFAIVEPYTVDKYNINHFDLYRIQEPLELEYIGFRDYFNKNTIAFIEWPERLEKDFNIIDAKITLEFFETGRILTISSCSEEGLALLIALKNNV